VLILQFFLYEYPNFGKTISCLLYGKSGMEVAGVDSEIPEYLRLLDDLSTKV